MQLPAKLHSASACDVELMHWTFTRSLDKHTSDVTANAMALGATPQACIGARSVNRFLKQQQWTGTGAVLLLTF